MPDQGGSVDTFTLEEIAAVFEVDPEELREYAEDYRRAKEEAEAQRQAFITRLRELIPRG